MARPSLAHIICLAASAMSVTAATQSLVIVCADDNDILRLLTSQLQPFNIRVEGSITSAIGAAVPGDGIMIMADNYPVAGTTVTAEQYTALAGANLSGVYIEMPSTLPGDSTTIYTPGVAEYFHRVTMYSGAASAWGLHKLDLMQAQVRA